ncbi:hypothetical protein C2845_PM15G14260 [Panicum miliaceum]|uniref:Uncharacterized protein n=1 Tax=Panicum miliaceum TaxID=4540 RepID=A0A3L6Q7C2_PANMI|nr:hypothetical protein C2845_PM15G14260 [Panicum miliaceum]
MQTKPFIRTIELLWQQGHTVHATLEEAEEAMQMIDIFTKFAFERAAVPVSMLQYQLFQVENQE